VATTLPRPQGDVFYCSPEALLGREKDPRSDLFSLGLVLLELATWRHLYSMADVPPRDLKKGLTPEVEKVYGSLMGASMNRRVVGPTSEDQLSRSQRARRTGEITDSRPGRAVTPSVLVPQGATNRLIFFNVGVVCQLLRF
jgi:serine/threonine protein kinase